MSDNPFLKYAPQKAMPEPSGEAAASATSEAPTGNPFAKYSQAPAADDRAGGALNAAARGVVNGVPIIGPALLGGIDRADAAVRAVTNDSKYSDEVAKAGEYGERMKAEHPTATGAGEIAGAVASTIPLVVAAPAAFGAGAAPLAIRAGASALTNAAIGGADGGVRSEGDLDAIKKGAVIGGLAGTLTPVTGAAIGKVAEAVASKVAPAAAVPGVAELKAAARAAYDRADQAGVQIAAPSFQAAIYDIGQSIRSAGLDKTIHPKTTAALARLEEAAGSSPTLKDVDLLRRVAKSAAGSIEPDEKRIGSILVDKIDDYMGRLKPGDLVSGDASAATDAMTEARTLWGRARRAELIDNALTAAEDRAASTGSGGNTENAIRQNIRGILSSPKKRAGFSGEEIDAMREVVRGGTVQNLARRLGKLAPEGLIGMMEIGAGMAHPSIETAAIPAVGYLAKKYAEHAADTGVRRLGDLVRSGGQIPVSPLALPARRAVEPLAINIFGGVPRVANQPQCSRSPLRRSGLG